MAISRASVIASFPVDAMLDRYAALLRRCNMDELPAPVICKRPASLFNHALNNTDAYGSAELDDVDRLFRDSKTRSALVSRTETCVALHYVFGHHAMFTPTLGEVARLLATLISVEELESKCQRVYFDTHIVGTEEGQLCDDNHVGRTIFWFVPKAGTSIVLEAAEGAASRVQTATKRQRTDDVDAETKATTGDSVVFVEPSV